MKDDDLERIYDVLEVSTGRVIRILTSVFPKYFAIITRVREEVRSVGPDGGKVVLPEESSSIEMVNVKCQLHSCLPVISSLIVAKR